MHASTAPNVQRIPSAASPARVTALVLAGLATACGGSSGGSGQSGVPGTEVSKPGADQTFFVDENQSGNAQNYQLEEVLWGRLVDVHEIDSNGDRVEDPVFEDFVVEPDILTNGTTYVLDRNPITQRERLTILARKRNLMMGEDSTAFDQLLAQARDALPSVAPKNDDGSSSAPFSTVPRNATVVLRFGDALDDDAAAAQTLPSTVRVYTGYPPSTPFSARVVFDPNHGAVVGGQFHSTRVLVDMTTSQAEANALPTPQDINPIGLPESLTSSAATNLSVRVPTETDVGSGQFQVLTNLAGVPVDIDANGPVDLTVPTLDVVRAMMSGNSDDPSNGFLTDVDRPRLIGGWAATVTAASDDPAGTPGREFLLDLTFDTVCAIAPAAGDVITVGANFLEVTADGNLVGSDVAGLPVRAAADTPDPMTLLGAGLYQAPFHPSLALDEGCWVTFLPQVGVPATEVPTTAQILARFSEPMDPDSLSPYGGFSVIEGAAGATSTANANNTVVGEVLSNTDLTVFSFAPSMPMPHLTGVATPLHVEIGDARDLAGNTLRHEPPFVDFTLAPIEPSQLNDAVVLRFDATDEYAPGQAGPDGLADLRGQFFYDTQKGSILPRPVAFTGWPIDRSNPVPMAMTLFPGGVLTPLSPLGAKLQTIWRYCDAGWNVRDETKYNLDVVGLSWSPVGGLVVADFYDLFEIRLGHSRFLTDEPFDPATGIPLYPASGLPGSPALFESNFLAGSNPKVVHNRSLGYTVNPANLFQSTSGTPMMPFPLNRGPSPLSTYTWRDTAVLGKGADGDQNQPGIPLGIESVLGVDVSSNIAGPGDVPSYGLPLLIELRCYPADRGLGLNAFDVSTSNPIFTVPNFRAYSAGGINTQGQPVVVQPDLEDRPRGGFNPNSTPPGLATTTDADGIFYIGQLDTVVRISRIHTAWLDTRVGASPTWRTPVQEPPPAAQPAGTQVQLAFRATDGFSGTGTISAPFNASTFDVYGDQMVNQPSPVPTDWSSNISVGNGSRYLQVRMTFVNNITTGNSAELTALALPYEYQ